MDLSQKSPSSLAWLLATLNLGFLPGLGTLLSRRWWSGAGQIVLSAVGGGLFLSAAGKVITSYYSLPFDLNAPTIDVEPLRGRMLIGMMIFSVSWFWSLVSSIAIVREARKRRENAVISPENR